MTDAFEPTTGDTTPKTGATAGGARTRQPQTLEQGRLESRSPSVDRAVHTLDSSRQWARQQVERAQDQVQAHPLRSTAYALGAGVVAGMVMRSINRGR